MKETFTPYGWETLMEQPKGIQALPLPLRRWAHEDISYYRVYRYGLPDDFVRVQADTAAEAYRLAGIESPWRIQREAWHADNVLEDGILTAGNAAYHTAASLEKGVLGRIEEYASQSADAAGGHGMAEEPAPSQQFGVSGTGAEITPPLATKEADMYTAQDDSSFTPPQEHGLSPEEVEALLRPQA